jgi:hypothetical protein
MGGTPSDHIGMGMLSTQCSTNGCDVLVGCVCVQPKGVGLAANGAMLPWFHGIISREASEALLTGMFVVHQPKKVFNAIEMFILLE